MDTSSANELFIFELLPIGSEITRSIFSFTNLKHFVYSTVFASIQTSQLHILFEFSLCLTKQLARDRYFQFPFNDDIRFLFLISPILFIR